jgi:Domain of unknown function (DUF1906)
MPLSAFDTATDFTTLGLDAPAHAIKALGYDAIGIYLDPRRSSQAMIDQGHAVGLRFWSFWEKNPENPPASWFTADRGTNDADEACTYATESVSQPKGTPIFFCIDNDLKPSDVDGYVIAVHGICTANGYLVGLYGSWTLIQYFVGAGYCHYGCRSGSPGWSGYDESSGKCAIEQQNEQLTVLGMDCDSDVIFDESVLF